MADGSLIEQYRERGYHVSEFSNVMVRPVENVAATVLPAGIEVQKAAEREIDLWTLTVAQGFAEHFPVTQEFLASCGCLRMERIRSAIFARVDGKIAGGATLALRGRIAGLFGASTLPQFGIEACRRHFCMRACNGRRNRVANWR